LPYLGIELLKVKGNIVRRVFSVVEIIDYDARKDKFEANEFLRFYPVEDMFKFKEKSAIISELIESRGGKEESVWTEIEKRRRILDEMHKNGILEFKDVSLIIKSYYKDPGKIFDTLEKYAAIAKKKREEEEKQLEISEKVAEKSKQENSSK
jgi:hypothetical protein